MHTIVPYNHSKKLRKCETQRATHEKFVLGTSKSGCHVLETSWILRFRDKSKLKSSTNGSAYLHMSDVSLKIEIYILLVVAIYACTCTYEL